VTTAVARCRVCLRPLTSRASVAEGMGPVCAVRAAQVPLDLDAASEVVEPAAPAAPATDYAATPFHDWPWVREHRAARAGDPRHVDSCDGCHDYGVCAWHAGRASARSAEKTRENAA